MSVARAAGQRADSRDCRLVVVAVAGGCGGGGGTMAAASTASRSAWWGWGCGGHEQPAGGCSAGWLVGVARLRARWSRGCSSVVSAYEDLLVSAVGPQR